MAESGLGEGGPMDKKSLDVETIMVGASYAALVAISVLLELLRFNGVTAVEVMGEVFVWLAPAGYVFGVWAIVCLALAVWAVRLVRDGHHARHLGAMPVGVEAALFAVSCLLGIVWLVLWHLRAFAVSALVIIVCTIIAVMLYVITRKRSNARWDWMPLSLYASWLAMVALVNVAHALTRSVTADMGLVPAISTFAVLIVLVLASFLARRLFDDVVLGLVVAWTGIGVGVHAMEASSLAGVALIVISVLGVGLALVPWERVNVRRRSPFKEHGRHR